MLARDEATLTFSEAAGLLPMINGRRVNPSAIWRWARKGVRGVRLESCLIGGRYVTSEEALRRFLEQLSDSAGEICD
jgi:hypothetical protein